MVSAEAHAYWISRYGEKSDGAVSPVPYLNGLAIGFNGPGLPPPTIVWDFHLGCQPTRIHDALLRGFEKYAGERKTLQIRDAALRNELRLKMMVCCSTHAFSSCIAELEGLDESQVAHVTRCETFRSLRAITYDIALERNADTRTSPAKTTLPASRKVRTRVANFYVETLRRSTATKASLLYCTVHACVYNACHLRVVPDSRAALASQACNSFWLLDSSSRACLLLHCTCHLGCT